MKLSTNDLRIILSSINEVVRGIGVKDLENKTSGSKEKIFDLEIKLKGLLNEQKIDVEHIEGIIWSCSDLQLIKSLLCILFQELDHFEFSTRMGFEEDLVWGLLKKIRESIDEVCY